MKTIEILPNYSCSFKNDADCLTIEIKKPDKNEIFFFNKTANIFRENLFRFNSFSNLKTFDLIIADNTENIKLFSKIKNKKQTKFLFDLLNCLLGLNDQTVNYDVDDLNNLNLNFTMEELENVANQDFSKLFETNN